MSAAREPVDEHALAQAFEAIEEIDDLESWRGRFALLSDPTRLRLLFCLHRGGLCVSDLAAAVGMRVSSVSHALLLHAIGAQHSPHRHRHAEEPSQPDAGRA